MNTIFNTCILASQADFINSNLIYYSHLVPVFFSIFLGLLVFLKSKGRTLAGAFFSFTIVFSLWLIGDLFAWVSNNYFIVYTTWSLLVYFEILFYLLGFYFILLFIKKKDLLLWQKIAIFAASLPPLIITVMQKSVLGFDHALCEVYNNNFLDIYKLVLEIFIVSIMFLYIVRPFIQKKIDYTKKTAIAMIGSMFLFLATFGITEYLASYSGNYDTNLYALFIIPIFLIATTYSIFTLDIFNLKLISTYFFVIGLLILTGIQLIFVSNPTDQFLTILTVSFSVILSFLLFKNLKKESDQRIQIEKLNKDLEKLIQQKESLMHLINHKVKGSFTHTKYIFSEILQGSFGTISPELKKISEKGLESDNLGIRTVDLILNASNLQKGIVQFEMKMIDLKDIALNVISEKKDIIQNKGLELETNFQDEKYLIKGDAFWMKEVISNLIDNAINYTASGKIKIDLEKEITTSTNKIVFFVKDTGVGIVPGDKKNLFTEGGRGKNSVKMNVNSTGYGLYSVKLVVQAHNGKVWVESEGKGKGSTFFLEFDAI
ncbi:MAG TPA: ATP-binding protein [Candidatus Paceibacterota bacterium]|nr:ATP-binding protein [Candidatus Paceibacterota bacterium]HPT18084.1 ATP-binding protein [Candidatus Paceibacterota bacterium]